MLKAVPARHVGMLQKDEVLLFRSHSLLTASVTRSRAPARSAPSLNLPQLGLRLAGKICSTPGEGGHRGQPGPKPRRPLSRSCGFAGTRSRGGICPRTWARQRPCRRRRRRGPKVLGPPPVRVPNLRARSVIPCVVRLPTGQRLTHPPALPTAVPERLVCELVILAVQECQVCLLSRVWR